MIFFIVGVFYTSLAYMYVSTDVHSSDVHVLVSQHEQHFKINSIFGDLLGACLSFACELHVHVSHAQSVFMQTRSICVYPVKVAMLGDTLSLG